MNFGIIMCKYICVNIKKDSMDEERLPSASWVECSHGRNIKKELQNNRIHTYDACFEFPRVANVKESRLYERAQ